MLDESKGVMGRSQQALTLAHKQMFCNNEKKINSYF